ncbi:MAG: murein L,D-transpeptidase catalytic domain family protein [Sphingomonadales bacterium]
MGLIVSRRHLLQCGAAAAVATAARPASAATLFATPAQKAEVNPALLARARAALDAKREMIRNTDVIGITDFSKASRDPRFYLVNMTSGIVTAYHVAHGRGSDPAHSGWLERFSNQPGSEASSNGAYVTGDIYHGKYGRSLRLTGLDYSNSNALERAIVIHGAWYAEPQVAEQYGKLGRSEGCFALSETNLQYVLYQLGPGRLLYADKI